MAVICGQPELIPPPETAAAVVFQQDQGCARLLDVLGFMLITLTQILILASRANAV